MELTVGFHTFTRQIKNNKNKNIKLRKLTEKKKTFLNA